MFTNCMAEIWNKSDDTKVDGITIPGAPTLIRSIDCDMQPYSTELLMKNYGYDIPVTKRFFIDDIADIDIGTVLKVNTDRHEVKKIVPWDDYFEVFTLEAR